MPLAPSPSPSARSRTGHFSIGFRQGWSPWQKDLEALLDWTVANQFGVIDLGSHADKTSAQALSRGLRIGSVDLPEMKGMISPDKGARKEAVAKNIQYITDCGVYGPLNHFLAMMPEKPELPRSENFGYMVESYQQLAPALEAQKAKIVIEGWPGAGVLCCTPEGYEAFFKECAAKCFGVNYDPSHLIRMGIDHIRFLREFVDRVYHVHGKDTEIIEEGLYRFGNCQDPTFGKSRGFGHMHWRYTIPGHGDTKWGEVFKILAENKYPGAISIELEDENFNGTTESEKEGLIFGRSYLESC